MGKPDINLLSFAHQRPLGTHHVGDLTPSSFHSDTLKISDCADGMILAGHVIGGKEDANDCNNHCSNVVMQADCWEIRGKYGFTIKGGSSNITLIGLVRGHGSVVDVDLGNISDQSDDITGPVSLQLAHELGSQEPITVRVLGATNPIILNPEQAYKVIFAIPGPFRSFFLKAYKFLKKLGLPI